MTFIIGEIGVNWEGDLELVNKMIKKSKQAGCNAVKFQSFNLEQIKNHPDSSRLLKTAITKNNVSQINDIANENKIEWFCTPMYPEAIDFLDPYVKRFKLREFDGREIVNGNSTVLFEKILKTKKEIIISSQNDPSKCIFYDLPNIKWLYCVPKYPCMIEDVDFTNIKIFDGFSNHSTDAIIPISAAILGTKMIEIHVTIDKKSNHIDNNVSFDFEQLTNLIYEIRKVERLKR